jgi:undecaprenyl-diphosphatase
MALLLAFQGWRTEALDAAALAASALGWWPVSLVLVGAAAGALLRAGRRRDALTVLLTLAAVGAGHGIKLLVQRPRPELLVIGPAPTGYSFPSAHALFAAALAGVLVPLLEELVKRPWLRRTAQALLVLLALAVGTSRIYLGVHWPSDVASGFVMGAASALGLRWWGRRRPRAFREE